MAKGKKEKHHDQSKPANTGDVIAAATSAATTVAAVAASAVTTAVAAVNAAVAASAVSGEEAEIDREPVGQPVLKSSSEEFDMAVRELAYFKWEAAGFPEGDGCDFWLEAERELRANEPPSNEPPSESASE